jgi:serine/threonine-protein kinase
MLGEAVVTASRFGLDCRIAEFDHARVAVRSQVARTDRRASAMIGDLKPGDELDGFRIVELLGQGASSEVVLALDRDDRRVVLKLPRDAAVSAPSTFDRFRRELAIASRLDHPGIQRSVDYRLDRSRPYLIMEYVDGETLADLLAREHRLSVDRAVDFASQLASAMAYAHERGIVHRDLKPLNILVVGDDRLVVTDFGIALLSGARRLTWQWFGASLGTPDYMSPEQIQGKRGDQRSDIFAMGGVLFEMLTGRVPWIGTDPMDVMNQHRSAPVPAMRDLGADVPPAIEGIVRRCLRKQPDERYPDATALLNDLEHWPELDASQFQSADEEAVPAAQEHLVLLVAGVCLGFLALSTLLVTASYFVAHR